MRAEEDDVIDFKPFFDLVVGVIFILLILIAAQMFFAQQQDDRTVSRDERAAELARRDAALRFLDGLAEDLKRSGIAAEVDRAALAVVVPTRSLVRTKSAPFCTGAVVDRAAAGRLAQALAGKLSCLAPPEQRPAICPAIAVDGRPDMSAELLVPTVQPNATPGAAHRALAIDLAAGIFSAEPGLLDLRTVVGSLMVDPIVRVQTVRSAVVSGADACGEIRLGFPLLDRSPSR